VFYGNRVVGKEQAGLRQIDSPREQGSLVKLYQGCFSITAHYLGSVGGVRRAFCGTPQIFGCNVRRSREISRAREQARVVGFIDHIVGNALYLVAVIRGVAPDIQPSRNGVV